MNKKTQLIVLTLILIVVLGGAGILYSRLSAGAQTGQLSSTTASDTDSPPGSAASDSQSPSSEPPAQEGNPAPDEEPPAQEDSADTQSDIPEAPDFTVVDADGNDIRSMPYDEAVKTGMIEVLGAETDEKFLANVMAQVNDPDTVAKVADTFKLVYTPFHGTGHKLIPEALRRMGIRHLICVPEQMVIDGNFPTVVSPNPENPEGFALAVELAKKEGADFILGSDPDADRVGIMVKTKSGEFKVISGNQTGVLMLDYLIGAMKRAGKLPEKPVALKTIVTTEMARKVAEVNGLSCYDTFTGFKFLAEKKDKLESSGEGKVIFSYEESYGYMFGDYVRDKDAVTASLMLTEMAAWYAAQGMTLADALDALFEKYGYYAEKTYNLVMPGLDGLKDMANLMQSLRQNPPAQLSGVDVVARKDYQDGSVVDCATGALSTMELTGSNVLRFEMADGTSVIVRPSGTEPKIKVYILTQGKDAADAAANLEKYGKWVDTLKK